MRNIELLILFIVMMFNIILLNKRIKIKKSLIIFTFFIFVYTGFRVTGFDIEAYYKIYLTYSKFLYTDLFNKGLSSYLSLNYYEPTVIFIANAGLKSGLGFKGFLLIYSLLVFILLILIIKKTNVNVRVAISTYMIIFFMSGPRVSIRASVSSLLIIYVFYYWSKDNKIKGILAFLLAFLFHYSSITLLFILLVPSKLVKRVWIIIVGIVIIKLSYKIFYNSIIVGSIIDIKAFKALYNYLYIYESEITFFSVLTFSRILTIAICNLMIIFLLNKQKNKMNRMDFLILKVSIIVGVVNLAFIIIGEKTVGSRIYEIMSVGEIILISKYFTDKVKGRNLMYILITIIGLVNICYSYLGYQVAFYT